MIRELSNKNLYSIPFLVFDKISSSDVEESIVDLPWEQLQPLFFSKHQVRKSKDGLNFWPVELKDRSEWILSEKKIGDNSQPTYRTKENVKAVTMVVMDLDEPGSKDLVESYFSNIEYLLYSTHSYNEHSPYKFRLIMPLESPILASDWDEVFDKIRPVINGDDSCSNLSRQYYAPSHSPDAKIDPVIVHNKGKKLNVDFINEIFLKATKDTPSLAAPKRRLGKRLDMPVSKNLNYTYEALCYRNEQLINKTLRQADNRHDFALRVIHKEVSKNKDDVNIPATIKFIFRAAKEFSTKPLHLGNTISEIPEMLSSSIAKEAPGILDKFKSHEDYASFIEKCLATALDESMTEAWVFPRYTPTQTAEDKINSYTKRSFFNRNKDSFKQLSDLSTPEVPLVSIMEAEAAREDTSYRKTINFLQAALEKKGYADPLHELSKALSSSDIKTEAKNKYITSIQMEKALSSRPEQPSPSPEM